MNYHDLIRLKDVDVDNALAKHTSEVSFSQLDAGQRRRLLGKYTIKREEWDREGCSAMQVGRPWTVRTLGLPCVYDEGVGYRTGSGNELALLVQLFDCDRWSIPLLTEWEHITACDGGGTICKGSSGSCPGYAPRFDSLRKGESRFSVLVVTIDMAWSLQYAAMLVPSWKNFLTWTDRLTSTYVTRIMRKAFEGHYMLGLGSCDGKCKPCAVLCGSNCRKPRGHTYSMEATGVDCDQLHWDLYGEWLPWAARGIKKMPTYMSRYAGCFGDANTLVRSISDAVESDKSYIEDEPELPCVPYETMVVPSGVHKGCKIAVYDVVSNAKNVQQPKRRRK